MTLNILIFIVLPLSVILFGVFLGTKTFCYEEIAFIFILVGAIALLSISFIIPANRMGCISENQRYEAFVETLTNMRENDQSIENAAIQKDIADWNQEIASAQYWQEYFPLFIPELVNDWEMIR